MAGFAPSCKKCGVPVTEPTGGSCDDPTHVSVCGPVEVVVTNPTPDKDVEYICDETTNTWWRICTLTTYATDGTPTVTEVSNTDTGVSCDDPPPVDPETHVFDTCVDGFLFHQLYAVVFVDGVAQPLEPIGGPVATGIECNVTQKFRDCGQQLFFEGGLDNTFTHFADTNQTLTLKDSDGNTQTVNIGGPFANFTDQINAFGVAVAAFLPDAVQVGTFCTIGCGGLPSPIVTLPNMKFRYVGIRTCPESAALTCATYQSDQRKELDLAVDLIESDLTIHNYCVDCDGNIEWQGEPPVLGEDGEPICFKPCVQEFPPLPEVPCTTEYFEPYCDVTFSGDPAIDDTVNATDIVIAVTTCGADQTIQFLNIEDGSLVPYPPVGAIVNCDTLEPFEPPPPDCPEGAVFECGEYKTSYFILDNSNWQGAPTPHITNGFNFEMTFTRADGSTVVWQQSADPLFNNFISTAPAALGCKVIPVCANHTSPKGCNAAHAANLAAYPAYDAPTFPADPQNNLSNPTQDELWASGWLLDCADCVSPVVRVEITAASDAAYVGAFKEPTVYESDPIKVYHSVNCDGVFWKDCDGNAIQAPVDLCCLKPCPIEVTGIPQTVTQEVCYKTTCEGLSLDGRYTTAPDALTDLTAPFFSYEIGGNEIIVFDEPVTSLTWDDYLAGGELEALLDANLDFPYTLSYEYLNQDGENGEVRIQITACLPDGAEGIQLTFKSGDATINGGVGTVTITGSGVLCTDKETGESVLISNGEVVTDYTIVECADNTLTPTGDCRCYGDESGAADEYVYVNSDNETEGSFSMNATTIKWQTGGGDGSLDGSIPYIDDCITNGGEATMTILDTEGNTVVFVADAFINPAGTAPTTAYSGTGLGGFSGKVREVRITCSTSDSAESGKACAYLAADGSFVWIDAVTSATLTAEQVETLRECVATPECTTICPDCPTENIQVVQCATETVEGQANEGDQILTVAVRDCDGVIQSSTQYNLSNGNAELGEPVATEPCDPEPDVETIEDCFVDTNGVQWTRILIIDPDDPSMFVEIFYDANLQLGTPAGEPKEWTPCPNSSGLVDIEKVCYEWFGEYYKGYAFAYSDGGVLISPSTDVGDAVSGATVVCCDDCIQVFGCRDGRLAFPIGATVVMANGDVLSIAGLRYSQVADLITDTYGGTNETPSLGGPQGPNFSQCQGSSQHELQFYNLPVDIVSITDMTNYGKFGNCQPAPEPICQIVERCILVGGVVRHALVSMDVKALDIVKTFDEVACAEVANPVFVDCCQDTEEGAVFKNQGAGGGVVGDFSNETSLDIENSDGTTTTVQVDTATYDAASGTTTFTTTAASQQLSVKAVKAVRI